MEFYQLKARAPDGSEIRMSEFKGKVVLVVNTATRCGLAPQFHELESLHQKYREKGVVVLGFPSNQFLNQEPESNETMEHHCQVNFGVTFRLTEKVKVNGKNTHPVFSYLKNHLKGKNGKRIAWNFTKFLIAPSGEPFRRYAPSVKPFDLEKDIIHLLP